MPQSEAQRAWRKRKRDEYIAAKYGPEFVGQRMNGRHRNHAAGPDNARWNGGVLVTSQGYVLVRVAKNHHRAFGPSHGRHRYAYEHDLVAELALGRELQAGEVVHHRNGDRRDNRWSNLEVTTRSAHAREHANHPDARDDTGRFRAGVARSGTPTEWPADLRAREFPA